MIWIIFGVLSTYAINYYCMRKGLAIYNNDPNALWHDENGNRIYDRRRGEYKHGPRLIIRAFSLLLSPVVALTALLVLGIGHFFKYLGECCVPNTNRKRTAHPRWWHAALLAVALSYPINIWLVQKRLSIYEHASALARFRCEIASPFALVIAGTCELAKSLTPEEERIADIPAINLHGDKR